jgi:hypothetical protein
MSSRRIKRIDKVIEKLLINTETESVSSNENENEIIETQHETIDLDEDHELQNIVHNSEHFLEKFYDIFLYIQNIFKFIFGVAGIYLMWICLHYFASHLYVKFCVPTTVMGFLLSPFMTATPHCQGLRWVVYNAANMINNMWIVCGTWICSTLLKTNPATPPDISS